MNPTIIAHIESICAKSAPPALPGWCDITKATYLADVVLCQRPHVVVELGVFGGRSLIPMALAMRELQETHGHTGLVIGIDAWTAEAAVDGMDREDADDQKHVDYWSKVPLPWVHRQCADKITELGLWPWVSLMQARSETVARIFSASPGERVIDLLHIDGNHTPLASCRDVELWVPRVATHGHIVFDDFNWPSVQPALALMEKFAGAVQEEQTPLCAYRTYRKH